MDTEIREAIMELVEHLGRIAKARIVDPLIKQLGRAVSRRFKAQAKHLAPPSLGVYGALAKKAYLFGATFTAAELGKMREAKRKQPMLPVAIAAALGGVKRTGSDVEKEIDATSLKALEDVAAEDVAAQYLKWATGRAASIAVTEISSAFHQGMADAASAISSQDGVEVQKAWNVEDNPCDVCLDNVDDGWIPEDILFASGDGEPPQHPNCRCSLSYRTGNATQPA